ncbi:unnamed protein product [marine sediment metagenome]|uniref:Uncharacterized protein n=1 Tax=marine sediment metagenome TaxID=412755 RepID=X0V9U4_9ZZZZ
MIDDQEYLSHKNDLFKEKEKLKEKIGDADHRADKWLELSERAFNFACYAEYWFENGKLEDKNTILRTIGSNFMLKDRRLFVELKNPWLIIKRGVENVELQKGRFEPSETLDPGRIEPSLPPVGSAWLPGQDSHQKPDTIQFVPILDCHPKLTRLFFSDNSALSKLLCTKKNLEKTFTELE